MNLIKRNNSLVFPSILDEIFKPDWLGGIENSNFNGYFPLVNIQETETNFKLELFAPGRKKEDFNIDLDKNVLTISSELSSENDYEKTANSFTRKEFSIISFKRSFTLPDAVNVEDIRASYENGILNLMLPKKEESLPKPKRLIEIE